jgi:hypothetical protein
LRDACTVQCGVGSTGGRIPLDRKLANGLRRRRSRVLAGLRVLARPAFAFVDSDGALRGEIAFFGRPVMASAPSATAATVDAVFDLAQLLNCGLDRKQVQICMALIDAGVNPHGLAAAIKELRAAAASGAEGAGGDGTVRTAPSAARR